MGDEVVASGGAGNGIVETGEATGIIPFDGGRPITVIGTRAIRDGFDEMCLRQARNARNAPGVTDLVLNPDAHGGYGAPVGSVLVSPTHVFPGPVGVDIKCSMSLLQLDLPEDAVKEKPVRRALIDAICKRIPTGMGRALKPRAETNVLKAAMTRGASGFVLEQLGVPQEWAESCEDSNHVGHDGDVDTLGHRLQELIHENAKFADKFQSKADQLGSYGGGNHFGECEIVRIADSEDARSVAKVFGLKDGHVAFLSHCGSRGFGNVLAMMQFRALQAHFERWGIPLPGGDRDMVYAPLGTPEADDYIDDMGLGANWATVNHLLINALVLQAFQEVIPGATGRLVYFISHNIARQEVVNNRMCWVHRKGATRAFPAGHHALRGTRFEATGHPILLPGNPTAGSVVMVAEPGAAKSCYSVNHGAGRRMGRRDAIRRLDQATVDREFEDADILSNCRQYPKDEAPAAYKDFSEVLRSVEAAGLARTVATLKARFVVKDGDTKADD